MEDVFNNIDNSKYSSSDLYKDYLVKYDLDGTFNNDYIETNYSPELLVEIIEDAKRVVGINYPTDKLAKRVQLTYSDENFVFPANIAIVHNLFMIAVNESDKLKQQVVKNNSMDGETETLFSELLNISKKRKEKRDEI